MARPFNSIMRLRVPSDFKNRLAAIARRRMVSVGFLIREQMSAYLALNEPAPLPERTARKKASLSDGNGDVTNAVSTE